MTCKQRSERSAEMCLSLSDMVRLIQVKLSSWGITLIPLKHVRNNVQNKTKQKKNTPGIHNEMGFTPQILSQGRSKSFTWCKCKCFK